MSTDTNLPWSCPIPVADLSPGQPRTITLAPDASQRQAIADSLKIQEIRKLEFTGSLVSIGKQDWKLTAKLGASVVQNCVVSLAPVTTRIDENTQRMFLAKLPEIEPGSELEIPEDDTIEELAASIDPGAIMVESLALALPQFPRAPGAQLAQTNFTEPGKTAMSDADARPFAQLKALRDTPESDTD